MKLTFASIIKRLGLSLVALLLLLNPVLVMAADPAPVVEEETKYDFREAYRSALYKYQFYDPNELCKVEDENGDGGADESTEVETSASAQKREDTAFLYFAKKLYDNIDNAKDTDAEKAAKVAKVKIWSAGIVGNLKGESGVNPKAIQTEGGSARGIAQWEGGRWSGNNGLREFAADRNEPWTDFGTQLDFLWWELTHTEKAALNALKNATPISVKQSAITFMLRFERPSIPHTAKRVTFAEGIYDRNKAVDIAGITGADEIASNSPADDTPTCLQNPDADNTTPSGECPPGTDAGTGDGYKRGKKRVITLCKVYGVTINASIATNFKNMYEAAKKDGLTLDGWGFRTMAAQIRLRRTNGCPSDPTAPSSSCRIQTAPPGYSNHQMGEAIDFSSIGKYDPNNKEYLWLKRNAAKYGLKNYPAEHWHWSVDGK